MVLFEYLLYVLYEKYRVYMWSTKCLVKFDGLKTLKHEKMENNNDSFPEIIYILFYFNNQNKILIHPLCRIYLFNHVKDNYVYKYYSNTI